MSTSNQRNSKMIIEHVRIVNCNRLSLGNKKDVTLRPRSKIQMILGTNGSGKSSFMDLCFNPLSPSPHDFDEGGYWEFKCTHAGAEYFLSADYSKKKYSFFKDGGENLNPGGTITVQDALVEQHLNYTRFIHGLLTLTNKLSSMGPRERGDVISKVSREDLSFAYGKFREWTKELNSNRSIQRFLLGRISEEELKLMPAEDVLEIINNIKKLKEELQSLMSLDRPDYDPSVSLTTLESLKETFFIEADKFLSTELPVLDGESVEEVNSKISSLEGKLEMMQHEIKTISDEASRVQNRKVELDRLGNSNIDEINDEIKKLEDYISQIPPKSIDVPDELLTKDDLLINNLISKLSCLDDTPEAFDLKYKEAMDLSNKINEALNKSNYALSSIKESIAEMVSVQEITCPHCAAVFKPGIMDGEISKLQERLHRGQQYVFELNKKNDIVSSDLSLLEDHKGAMEAIYVLRDKHYQKNRGMFMYIDSLGGFRKGKLIISHLSIYSREVTNRARLAQITERLAILKKVLNEHAGKNMEMVQVTEEYNRLEAMYQTKFDSISELSAIKGMGVASLRSLSNYETAYNRVVDSHNRLTAAVRSILCKEFIKIVEEEISKRQSSLALNENALSNNELIETLIKDFNIQLKKASLDVKVYKTLVDVINPKTGLIAERMHAQVGSKVDGINTIIKKIWSYDFRVKMPSLEGGQLDYKFPIEVDGVVRSDISKGSGSMVHIVDTSFAALAHHSMGLEGYPIYLDEFDSTFDAVHSNNMIHMVKDLADSGRYGYVVVISHDEDIQNAFPEAEILVLDDRNLSDNKGINSHVTFK